MSEDAITMYLSTFNEPERTDLLDYYEETAAALQYDLGNTRARAERFAFALLQAKVNSATTDGAERT